MNITRRSTVLGLGAALLPALPVGAQDADLTAKPIRVICGYGAGGGADAMARYMADKLSGLIGQRVVVENRPGADGNIAAEAVARANTDEIWLLVSGVSTHATNATIYKTLSFDPEKDFTPIAAISAAPYVLVVNPDRIKATNLKEFIDFASQPGKSLSYASANVGGRLSGELFRRLAKIQAVNVAYRNSAQAMTDLLGGQVDFYFCDAATAIPQIEAGKLKAIAVTTKAPVNKIPNVPPLARLGYPDFDISSWIAVWSAGRTPAPVSARIAKLVQQVFASQAADDFIGGAGFVPMRGTPEGLRDLQRRDTELLRPLIIEAGMQKT